MALNLTRGNNNQQVSTINLQKVQTGQMINLSKEAPALNEILVKLVWQSNKGSVEVDMDVSAVLVNGEDKAVPGVLASDPVNGDTPRALVYYNNEDGTKGVKHGGDIKGGGTEEMFINLKDIEDDVNGVVVVASTHSDGEAVNMGMAKDPVVYIINVETNEALFEIDLEDVASVATSAEIVRFEKKRGEFRMKPIAASVGSSPNGLTDIVARYF